MYKLDEIKYWLGYDDSEVPMTRYDPIFVAHDRKVGASQLNDTALTYFTHAQRGYIRTTIFLSRKENHKVWERAALFVLEQELKYRKAK